MNYVIAIWFLCAIWNYILLYKEAFPQMRQDWKEKGYGEITRSPTFWFYALFVVYIFGPLITILDIWDRYKEWRRKRRIKKATRNLIKLSKKVGDPKFEETIQNLAKEVRKAT